MGNAWLFFLLGSYALWSGIATLRRSQRQQPTTPDDAPPLRNRRLQIGHGIWLLIAGLCWTVSYACFELARHEARMIRWLPPARRTG